YHIGRPIFLLIISLPPRSTSFPYTTLFRSATLRGCLSPRARPVLRERFSRRGGMLRTSSEYKRASAYCTARPITIPARSIFLQKDRKSTRLNSSHLGISYAVFCLKKKNQQS